VPSKRSTNDKGLFLSRERDKTIY